MSFDVYDFRKFEVVVEKELSKLQRHLISEHRHQVEKILNDVATMLENSGHMMGAGSRSASRNAWCSSPHENSPKTLDDRKGETSIIAFSPNGGETAGLDVELSTLDLKPDVPIPLSATEQGKPKSPESKPPLLAPASIPSEAAKEFRQRRKSKTIDLAEVYIFKPPDQAADEPPLRLNLFRPREDQESNGSIASPSSPPPQLTITEPEDSPVPLPGVASEKPDEEVKNTEESPSSVPPVDSRLSVTETRLSVATQRLSGLSDTQKQRIEAIRRASDANSPRHSTADPKKEARSSDAGSDGSGSDKGSDDSAKNSSDGNEGRKQKLQTFSNGSNYSGKAPDNKRISLAIPQAPSALRNSRGSGRESGSMRENFSRASKRSITLGGGGPGEMKSLEDVMAKSRTSILSRSGSMGGGPRLLTALQPKTRSNVPSRAPSLRSLRISEHNGSEAADTGNAPRRSLPDEKGRVLSRSGSLKSALKNRVSLSVDNLTDLIKYRDEQNARDFDDDRDYLSRRSSTDGFMGLPGRRASTESVNTCSSTESNHEDHFYEVLAAWRPHAKRKRSRKEMLGLQSSSNVFETHEELQSEEDEATWRFMVQPGSAKHISWDIIGLLFIAWDCIYIPLEWFDPPKNWFTTSVAWFVRIYWTLATIVYFLIGYIDDQGDVQMRPWKVAKRYVTTWFGMDFMLVLLDWLEVFVNSGSSALRVTSTLRSLRILRTIRLFRVLKAPLVWRYITEQIRSEELILVAHIAKIMTYMLMVVHVLACAWYGIGRAKSGTPNWIEAPGSNAHYESMGYRYFLSVHWSLSAFSGETLINSENLLERCFTVFTLFFAFMFSASLVSSITTAMTRLEIMSRQQSWQLMQLRRYLVDNHISHKLKVRVQRNAQHVMLEQKRNMPESAVNLLSVISEPLLVELHFEVRSVPLMEHPFFCCFGAAHPSSIRKVCHTAVSLLSLSSGDVLFSDGDVPTTPAMYFMMSGRVRYKQEASGSDSCNVIVDVGQWLCEGVLWTHWTHHGTLRAESESRLLSIDAEKFQGICSATPMVQMQRYAFAYVEILNVIEKEEVTDLGYLEDPHLEEMIAYAFPELYLESEMENEEDEDDTSQTNGLGHFRVTGSDRPNSKPTLTERVSGQARESIIGNAVARLSGALGLHKRHSAGAEKKEKPHPLPRLKKGNTNNNLNHILRTHKRTHRTILNAFMECVCCPCSAVLFCLRKCCKHRKGDIPRHWSLLLPSSSKSRRPVAMAASTSDFSHSGRRPSVISLHHAQQAAEAGAGGRRPSVTSHVSHQNSQPTPAPVNSHSRRPSVTSNQVGSLAKSDSDGRRSSKTSVSQSRRPSTTSVTFHEPLACQKRPSLNSMKANESRRPSTTSVTMLSTLKPVEETHNRLSTVSAVSDYYDTNQAESTYSSMAQTPAGSRSVAAFQRG